jgi:hypothetical protein
MRLRNEYQNHIGNAPTNLGAWFGNQLSTCLTSLCIDAAIESHGSASPLTTYLRQNILAELESYLGRNPTAEDLIKEFARHSTVPKFVAAVLCRAVERRLSR